MDVNVLAEILPQRLDQARMRGEQAEHFAEGVGREGGARRAGFLPPDFLPVGGQDVLRLGAEELDLLLGEAIGKEDEALFVEAADLFGAQSHAVTLY